MPRKLVTVRHISTVTPIPGAHLIEAATVDGWVCVVPARRFKPGDRGLYFEIDALLPASDPRWASLAPTKILGAGGPTYAPGIRIKTRKIRGVLSQGLLMPLSDFPEVVSRLDAISPAELRDVGFEDILSVRKYEAPTAPLPVLDSTPLPDFPAFVPRTEEERVQNLPNVLDVHGHQVFQESTKMDGSSMTVFHLCSDSPLYKTLPEEVKVDGVGVGVCSRNRILVENHPRSPPLFYATARALRLPETLAKIGRNVAVQGELCGSTIQGNFEGFAKDTHSFFLFAVYDIDAQHYLPPREAHETWAPQLGVKHVPVHGYRRLREVGSCVEDLVTRADGKGLHGRKREGIVFKREDGQFSFKAISNSYLLKHGE
ncbi:hypothetical protein F66182_9634 [Fusarium sp. NRRL 66182]|nr:hypothetical protein F66182_9634 [Fusarium sp. NRRL 66182]